MTSSASAPLVKSLLATRPRTGAQAGDRRGPAAESLLALGRARARKRAMRVCPPQWRPRPARAGWDSAVSPSARATLVESLLATRPRTGAQAGDARRSPRSGRIVEAP